jgi:hypothetical protein
MKIGYNPITQNALTACPSDNDIIFDLPGLAIYAKGVKFLAANAPVANPTYNPTSISLTKDWIATGFYLNSANGFTNGLYAIKITSGNLIFSGVASVYVGKITVDDEIMLHMSGIPKTYSDGTQGRIYAKIAPSNKVDYGEIYLSTNVPQSAITNLSITMKKLI